MRCAVWVCLSAAAVFGPQRATQKRDSSSTYTHVRTHHKKLSKSTRDLKNVPRKWSKVTKRDDGKQMNSEENARGDDLDDNSLCKYALPSNNEGYKCFECPSRRKDYLRTRWLKKFFPLFPFQSCLVGILFIFPLFKTFLLLFLLSLPGAKLFPAKKHECC